MTDRDPILPVTFAPTPIPSPASGSLSVTGSKTWQEGDTTSFRDVLAILNPLQHIPVISTIYRAVTGDSIGFMPNVIGGALYGGPIGFALSLVDSTLKSETGRDAGETVVASLFGGSPPPAVDAPADLVAEAPIQTAAAVPPAEPTTPAAPAKSPLPGAPLAFQNASHSAPQNPLSARFRSTDLPQPEIDGGARTHTAKDLVPTAAGTAISRDAVPAAMASALEKYGAMMRARNTAQLPTQVSVLR